MGNGEAGEHTADELLELAAEMRVVVEHNAGAYREEAAHDSGSSDDDADHEADDEGEEGQQVGRELVV